MKIIEKMKDERLGSAVLYNFTLGYGKPVPMDVYNYVLPFMFHDLFRNKILESTSFNACVRASFQEDYRCLDEFKILIQQYENLTSQALGLALVSRWMTFENIEDCMYGIALNSNVLLLNEAYRLGEWFKEMSIEEIMECLDIQREQIVILEMKTSILEVFLDMTGILPLTQFTVMQLSMDQATTEVA